MWVSFQLQMVFPAGTRRLKPVWLWAASCSRVRGVQSSNCMKSANITPPSDLIDHMWSDSTKLFGTVPAEVKPILWKLLIDIAL